MQGMFFDSWAGLVRIAVVGPLAYVALVLFLRIAGKRTLTKLNAFDFVVTVALGSTLATVLLSKSVPLAEGVLGLALLILLQFVITWLSVRVSWFETLVKSEPTLLMHHGQFLDRALRATRVTKEEVFEALRQHGVADAADAGAVILETDGSMSVLMKSEKDAERPTMTNVDRRGETPQGGDRNS